MVRETAVALGSLRADPASLVIACRRIVERHPEVGPMWWLCARLLTAQDSEGLAWQLADEIEADPTARAVARALPDDGTVITIGWPEVAGAAVMRRGDLTVLCADSRHEASSFMLRLERHDVRCEPIPIESLAAAVAAADLALIEAVAASSEQILAPVGSTVLAAVAHAVATPVWLVAGLGRRLPCEYVQAIASGATDGVEPCDRDLDEVPLGLITHVAVAEGVVEAVPAALRPDGPYAPELLRSSPF